MRTVHVGSNVAFVWLHTSMDPDPREWEESMDDMLRTVDELDRDVSRTRLFVVTDGGAPNAKQRKQLFEEILRRQRVPTAVITNSLNNPVRRGVATLLTWINPEVRTFLPHQARGAYEHVGCVAPQDNVAIWNALAAMQQDLTLVNTLREMAIHLGLNAPVRWVRQRVVG